MNIPKNCQFLVKMFFMYKDIISLLYILSFNSSHLRYSFAKLPLHTHTPTHRLLPHCPLVKTPILKRDEKQSQILLIALRGVFRILSNVYVGAFCKMVIANFLRKKRFHHRCMIGSYITSTINNIKYSDIHLIEIFLI